MTDSEPSSGEIVALDTSLTRHVVGKAIKSSHAIRLLENPPHESTSSCGYSESCKPDNWIPVAKWILGDGYPYDDMFWNIQKNNN